MGLPERPPNRPARDVIPLCRAVRSCCHLYANPDIAQSMPSASAPGHGSETRRGRTLRIELAETQIPSFRTPLGFGHIPPSALPAETSDQFRRAHRSLAAGPDLVVLAVAPFGLYELSVPPRKVWG